MVSKPYAKVLKEAFPHATFVGFTGTPIAETYQTFGDEIDRYTMDQAVADGLTVSIKYHLRIAKVLLDNKKVKEIENYYKKCADDGATYEDIEASKKAMSSMEIILGEPSRLERLATDIHNHYVASCAGDPDRIQKAMVVCSNRKIAYALLQKFKDKYPEWFEEKKSPDGVSVTEEELKELKPMPFMAMVSSVGSNDEKDMYDYLGGVKNDKRSEELDAAFKQEKSNFSIVIVVDMWITGFDVPCLTYLYNDKPLKKHLLIQTISRVNRKYPGKEYGMVIDYIGIRDNMREAMKVYGGDGDYLFDKLKNTTSELQNLEDEIADIWKSSIKENGLIVIGYAGNDNSVMSVLEDLIKEGDIKKGVYWCKTKDSKLSEREQKFMENVCNDNEQSAVVEIEDFDDLMYSIYVAMNLNNSNIDELWKANDKKQEITYNSIGRHTEIAITNALHAIQFPKKCYVFSSNISTWKELRATINDSCVAILHKGKVWALGSKNGILEAFADKIISNIEEMDIPTYMMKLENSDVIGMFYEIIEKFLISKGLIAYGKNKYFDRSSRRLINNCFVYDAIKISLSFVDDNVIMNLLPTVHVLKSDESQLDRFSYQSKMRELKNENVYFDLHDSLKIYCAGKGIVTQIIEERSVHTKNDMAKIMWGLSTAIYAKAIGKLWKPRITRYDTAYIGLSYVQSIKNDEKISIGCSQLFDSEGNGMELYLRPLKDPQIIQRNPYMRSGDACRLMNNLKRIYDESVPLHKLNRIVIHKTTHFTKEEMEGITKGLAGVDNIELLQIQEFSAWRAIRFQNDIATPFPIQRGTVIPLDKDTFLIWTHGSVQHDELAGKKLNYYKNGRGIPAPLLVKRFMGKSSALELVNEILMLTKMNWNSGDGLYKILPVTLDFAKALSRVAKQDLVIYDRPYDFRYFM